MLPDITSLSLHILVSFSIHRSQRELTIVGCYFLLILTLIFLRINLGRRNKKKMQALESGEAVRDVNLVTAFADLTDKENPNFFYIY